MCCLARRVFLVTSGRRGQYSHDPCTYSHARCSTTTPRWSGQARRAVRSNTCITISHYPAGAVEHSSEQVEPKPLVALGSADLTTLSARIVCRSWNEKMCNEKVKSSPVWHRFLTSVGPQILRDIRRHPNECTSSGDVGDIVTPIRCRCFANTTRHRPVWNSRTCCELQYLMGVFYMPVQHVQVTLLLTTHPTVTLLMPDPSVGPQPIRSRKSHLKSQYIPGCSPRKITFRDLESIKTGIRVGIQ